MAASPIIAALMSSVRIELSKDYLHFSAAHFTIFSSREREDLHGHNFQVACRIDADVAADGLCFDYNVIKTRLRTLCDELDEQVLLPARSPHLIIGEEEGYVTATFGDERIPFLPRDVTLLPVANATIESFAQYLLDRLAADEDVKALPLIAIEMRVSSAPGQWATSRWENS